MLWAPTKAKSQVNESQEEKSLGGMKAPKLGDAGHHHLQLTKDTRAEHARSPTDRPDRQALPEVAKRRRV